MVRAKLTSLAVWSFTCVNFAINFIDHSYFHLDSLFWLCAKQWMKFEHDISHINTKSCCCLCFHSKSDQTTASDFGLQIFFAPARTFIVTRGKKAKHSTEKNYIGSGNQIFLMTFSRALAFSDRKALSLKCLDAETIYAPVGSEKVHTATHSCTHCLPTNQKVRALFHRQSFTVSSSLLIGFTQTQPTDLSQKQLKTPFTFLQWAHELPKGDFPHQPSPSECNSKTKNSSLFPIFIWMWPGLKGLWTEQIKALLDQTNLSNKYLIETILAFWTDCRLNFHLLLVTISI